MNKENWIVLRGKVSFGREMTSSAKGFTLLEVLVAMAVLGIAITVILQLFSSSLRLISASGDYVSAVTKAEAKMREVLDDDKLSEKSFSETTYDGYRMDVAINEVLKEKTENLQVRLFEIDMTIHWLQGKKEKSITLRTMKVMKKEI
jgi:prepilin-type N-terminal cleavage/methylation domain-containing protein